MKSNRVLMIGLLGVASSLLLPGLALQAQPPGGGGFGSGFGGSLGLLMREDVRKELELLDEQLTELQRIGEGIRSDFQELMSDTEGLSREERFRKMRELGDKVRDDAEAKVNKVLLPHQQRRLEQLANQSRLGGGTRGLTSDRIAEELNLSDSQKEKLKAKAEKLQAEIRQKLAELQKQAQEELLKELTPQQQTKWKEMVGDPFEFQPQQRQFGRGGQ